MTYAERMKEIDAIMQAMPENWRTNWCESETCWCPGCANGGGKLDALGITKDEWVSWLREELRRLYGLINVAANTDVFDLIARLRKTADSIPPAAPEPPHQLYGLLHEAADAISRLDIALCHARAALGQSAGGKE